jgi:hypothetical protein
MNEMKKKYEFNVGRYECLFPSYNEMNNEVYTWMIHSPSKVSVHTKYKILCFSIL